MFVKFTQKMQSVSDYLKKDEWFKNVQLIYDIVKKCDQIYVSSTKNSETARLGQEKNVLFFLPAHKSRKSLEKKQLEEKSLDECDISDLKTKEESKSKLKKHYLLNPLLID